MSAPLLRVKLATCCLLTLLCLTVAQAQNTNPAPEVCGLPKGGSIYSTVTYTLTADCTQSDTLYTSNFTPDGKLTIDGQGYTIDATALSYSDEFFHCGGSTGDYEVEIKDVTIRGGGKSGSGAIYLWDCDATLTNVTFTESAVEAIWGYTASSTWTLNNILVENLRGYYWGYTDYGALTFSASPTVTITNIVFRDIADTAGAIIANPAYSYIGTPSITINGCLTVERVYAQFTNATITDNSTGKCTGTIGNGGSAVMPNPAPTVSACGLPLEGHLQTSASFVLSADCQLTGPLYIPKGLTVNINGNGYTIRSASNKIGISSAGTTTITNTTFEGGQRANLLAHLKSNLTVRQSTFKNHARPPRIIDATLLFDKVIFEDNDVSYRYGSALEVLKSATVTVRDSMLRNNSGALSNGAIYMGYNHYDGNMSTYPTVTLEGCTTFLNNSPADTFIRRGTQGTLTDNTNDDPFPCQPQLPRLNPDPPDRSRQSSGGSGRSAAVDAHGSDSFALGAFARVYRSTRRGQHVLSIWGIDRETSQGFHMLTVEQTQVEAMSGAGVVASSSDCRAQLLVNGEGDIVLKVGPNYEGKMLHAALDGSLMGAVVSQYTTFDDPICASAADAAPAPFSNCMAHLDYILNFRAAPGGEVMRILRYGDTLTVLQRSGDWIEVDYHGQRGWVSANHVTFVGGC